MIKPRTVIKALLIMIVCAHVALFCSGAGANIYAQQTTPASESRARGIELYQQGDLKGAIENLQAAVRERKDDADAWFYLGLSFIAGNDVRSAHKAYETAVKLRPDFAAARAGLGYALLLENKLSDARREASRALSVDANNADAHYIIGAVELKKNSNAKALYEAEAALKLNPALASALLLKTRALLALSAEDYFLQRPTERSAKSADKDNFERVVVRMREAAESLEQYLKLDAKAEGADFWREQLEALYVFTRRDEQAGAPRTIFHTNEVDKRPRILKREFPAYTQAAREAGFEGKIHLLAVLGADAQVKNVLVLQTPGYGLTRGAINATRGMTFEPAVKDGKPVSAIVGVEYSFSM
jgi:Tfp pilus assembly protein PilF